MSQWTGLVDDEPTFDKVYNREFIKDSAVELVESNGVYMIPPPAPDSIWGDALYFKLKERAKFIRDNDYITQSDWYQFLTNQS